MAIIEYIEIICNLYHDAQRERERSSRNAAMMLQVCKLLEESRFPYRCLRHVLLDAATWDVMDSRCIYACMGEGGGSY